MGQEFKQFRCLVEDAEMDKEDEELERLFSCVDCDSSSSSQSSREKKKDKKEKQKKTKKEKKNKGGKGKPDKKEVGLVTVVGHFCSADRRKAKGKSTSTDDPKRKAQKAPHALPF